MAFRARKVFGTFEKRAPGRFSGTHPPLYDSVVYEQLKPVPVSRVAQSLVTRVQSRFS